MGEHFKQSGCCGLVVIKQEKMKRLEEMNREELIEKTIYLAKSIEEEDAARKKNSK